MTDIDENDRTFNKNLIKSFILRVDLLPNKNLNLVNIAESMMNNFDRIEKRQVKNFTVSFTQDKSEVGRGESFDIVLVSEKHSMSMTFSEVQNSFWIQSSQYKNNSVYKGIIKEVIKEISEIDANTNIRRIGLRYVNEFSCDKILNIGRIYGKRIATIVKAMMREVNQTRVVGVEEYNNEGNKLRLQFGILNKFYPSIITVYNLLLDIDSYTEATIAINESEEIISELNHAAYAVFMKEMNTKYLEKLK